MKVHSINGKELGELKLPEQFNEPIRKDLIKRAYNAIRTHEVQAQGVMLEAGMRHTVELKKRRKVYKSVYGHGRSRTPRKTMSARGKQFSFVGAQVPFAVGGRVAHPPKAEKVIIEKVNKKENRKAIRSAISASKTMIIEDKFEKIKKTKEVINALVINGLKIDVNKHLKKGVARLRGRSRSYSKGPLLIVSDKCDLIKSGSNIPGIEVIKVSELNVKLLAPGSKPGRNTVWSESSIKKLKETGLFL
ncbi:MAG: 50S ribosomal protein L4 [Candidatus Nanoarchaeia archaeon]|jgi:large subunit ribosomal protein L4e